MSYNDLNVYNAIRQLYLNKTGRKDIALFSQTVQFCPRAGPVATKAVKEPTYVVLSSNVPSRSERLAGKKKDGEEGQS